MKEPTVVLRAENSTLPPGGEKKKKVYLKKKINKNQWF